MQIRQLGLVGLGPPALAVALFVASYAVYPGTGGSDVQPMPQRGKSSILHLVNKGSSLRFHDRFGLTLEQKVEPGTGVGMPDRPSIHCNFQVEIIGNSGRRSVVTFDRLRHAGEDDADHTAFFVSDLFYVPAGHSTAMVSNLGCSPGIPDPKGLLSIEPVGEHLMLPIAADLLRDLGWATAVWALFLAAKRFAVRRKIALQ
ncbi:hypothetical protein [Novosphingobium sp. PhB165]|uniref:hypothetical protein n=1 Tax=Novosphingobium sp. PhB165 TaxID=2485105 RepID=UPI0014043594|nr:hypothetical protein [Novosphingobium sp. PhB165]